MKKMIAGILCFLSFFPLLSFELWENGKLLQHFDSSELEAYSFVSGEGKVLPLSDILQVYDSISEIEVYSLEGTLNLKDGELIARSSLRFEKDQFLFQAGPHRFSDPIGIRLYGDEVENKDLSIWLPAGEKFLEEELKLFARNHGLQLQISFLEDVPRTLAHAQIHNETLPDLVLFEHRNMLFAAPYLQMPPWEIPPGILDIAMAEGQGALTIPLYYRLYQWDVSSNDAAEMAGIFLFLNRNYNLQFRDLLECLAGMKGFETGELTEIRICTLGIPQNTTPGPVEKELVAYLTREGRIGEILNQQEGIYSREEALQEDLSAGIPSYTWKTFTLYDRLLHILPQVRSGLINVDQAMELLNEWIDE